MELFKNSFPSWRVDVTIDTTKRMASSLKSFPMRSMLRFQNEKTMLKWVSVSVAERHATRVIRLPLVLRVMLFDILEQSHQL
jgi:hypothetical protein